MGSPWVVGVLVAVGTTGLLLPLLLAPVTSDSRYHYLAAPERFDDSLLGVLPWTIDDIQGRLEAGRFAPLGVFVQHVLYYLGMKLALFTGMEVYLAEAVIKTGLLAVVVLCFRALLRRLRDSGGQGLARHERDVGPSVPGRLPEAGLVGQIALVVQRPHRTVRLGSVGLVATADRRSAGRVPMTAAPSSPRRASHRSCGHRGGPGAVIPGRIDGEPRREAHFR